MKKQNLISIYLFFITLILSSSIQATTVYYWRVWCNTENDWVYSWSETEPVICPNTTGSAHSINPDSISEFEQLSENFVEIQEESIPTGGHYKAETIKLQAATGPGTISEIELMWPMPISMISVNFVSTDDHKGDYISLEVPSNQLIGTITEDLQINESVISATQEVIDLVKIGYYLTLNDENNSDDLGRIITIDKNNLTITMENPATHSYDKLSPTLIYLTVCPFKDFEIGEPTHRFFGDSCTRTSHVPKNMKAIIKYRNNSAYSKEILFEYEYLY